MKKLLAIFGFLAISLLSTDNAIAQEKKMNFQAIAKQKTHRISTELNLQGDAQRAVYNAYMLRERKFAAMQNSNTEKKTLDTQAIDTELYRKLQTVLTKEQVAKIKQLAFNNTNDKKSK